MFRERQQIIIFALAGLIVGGFVFLLYLPLRKDIKTVEREKAAQMFAVAKLSAETRQMPALKEQLMKLQQEIGNCQGNIPSQRDMGEFLRKMADLMNENHLKEQVITPGREIEAGNLMCIPVDMQCKGKLDQIFEFYKRLQILNRLIRIERVELTNDSDFNGQVSMQTKAIIYYQPQLNQG